MNSANTPRNAEKKRALLKVGEKSSLNTMENFCLNLLMRRRENKPRSRHITKAMSRYSRKAVAVRNLSGNAINKLQAITILDKLPLFLNVVLSRNQARQLGRAKLAMKPPRTTKSKLVFT